MSTHTYTYETRNEINCLSRNKLDDTNLFLLNLNIVKVNTKLHWKFIYQKNKLQ